MRLVVFRSFFGYRPGSPLAGCSAREPTRVGRAERSDSRRAFPRPARLRANAATPGNFASMFASALNCAWHAPTLSQCRVRPTQSHRYVRGRFAAIRATIFHNLRIPELARPASPAVLMTSHRKNATVADIAHAQGFYELGRFASDTQRLFGELPAQTLRRRVPEPRAACFRIWIVELSRRSFHGSTVSKYRFRAGVGASRIECQPIVCGEWLAGKYQSSVLTSLASGLGAAYPAIFLIASATARARRASSTCRFSTSLPFTTATPLPSRWACSQAWMMAPAFSTS